MKKWKYVKFELPGNNTEDIEDIVFVSDGKKVWKAYYDHIDKIWRPGKETYQGLGLYGDVKFWAEIELPEVPTKIMHYFNEDEVRKMCGEFYKSGNVRLDGI